MSILIVVRAKAERLVLSAFRLGAGSATAIKPLNGKSIISLPNGKRDGKRLDEYPSSGLRTQYLAHMAGMYVLVAANVNRSFSRLITSTMMVLNGDEIRWARDSQLAGRPTIGSTSTTILLAIKCYA